MICIPVIIYKTDTTGCIYQIGLQSLVKCLIKTVNFFSFSVDDPDRCISHVVFWHIVSGGSGIVLKQGVNSYLIGSGLHAHIHGLFICDLIGEGVLGKQLVHGLEDFHIIALGLSVVIRIGDRIEASGYCHLDFLCLFVCTDRQCG